MGAERYVLLAHGHVRSGWFREVARWSTAASLPIELVKTMSVDEVRVRLTAGRAYSALLIDDGVVGLDRDLIDVATNAGVPVVVVGSERGSPRWTELGATAIVAPDFEGGDLVQLLAAVATPVPAVEASTIDHAPQATTDGFRAPLVAVTGAPGSGRSTVAIALAQGLGTDARLGAHVCLADLALRADQAMLHNAPDVVPGLLELVEAHRFGRPSGEQIHDLTWEVPARGYQLLIGLRRHREWTSVRPRALAAAIDGLRRAFRLVVADIDGDLEGERATGSVDVEERNTLSRAAVDTADLVIAVGCASLQGTHAVVRSVRELVDHGVPCARILPLVNHAPRSPRARAEIARAHSELLGPSAQDLPSPLFAGARRQLDALLRTGTALPHAWVAPLAQSVQAVLARAASSEERPIVEPVPIVPGSLGAWADR